MKGSKKLVVVATLAGLAVVMVAIFLLIRERSNQRDASERHIRQERAILMGIRLGLDSMASKEYISSLINREPAFNALVAELQDIFVLDETERIKDSLDKRYTPFLDSEGRTAYWSLKDVSLPQVIDVARGEQPSLRRSEEPRAYRIPVPTDQGSYHIVIVTR